MEKRNWTHLGTLFLSLVLAVSPAFADSALGVLWTCSNDTETRTLSIGEKDGGCELHYEKNDEAKVVASSGAGTEHCEKSRDKIRDSLKKAGWKCTKSKM